MGKFPRLKIQNTHTYFIFAVDDVQFGYDCVICRERYTTRSERNEHLETHFIHKECPDCNRLVIMIGDLEFELHRPTYCTANKQNVNMKPVVMIERLDDINIEPPSTANIIDEQLKDETESIEYSDVHSVSFTEETQFKEDAPFISEEVDDDPPEPSKRITRKKPRKKPIKTEKKFDDDKSTTTNRIPKTRPIKKITCTQDGCSEEFRQQQLLRKHLKTVHGIVEKHLCSICNFAFADKSNLKHHMVTHTDNKRFICSFCGARFHKLTNMTEHMNAHLGLKPYKCEICNKDFGRANHKRQHMRVHTGEKPYGCQINDCTRAYMFKIDLKRHQRSVHGIIDRTFPCQICSKIFYENKYLTKHLSTAHS